jgi:hypothetical protein
MEVLIATGVIMLFIRCVWEGCLFGLDGCFYAEYWSSLGSLGLVERMCKVFVAASRLGNAV